MEVDSHANSNREQRIREIIEAWRSKTIAQLGMNPEQFDWCCRNSKVMHDIYVDAIAKSASSLHSLEDFNRVAQYWRLLEQYGSEVYEMICDELSLSKRLADSRTECEEELQSDYRCAKRQRIRA